MNKFYTKHHILTQAVLASTFFFTPLALANTVITGEVTVTQQTSLDGNITVTPTGIINTANIDAVKMDSNNATVTLDPNNDNSFNPPNAIFATNNGNGINITTGTNATIVVGANTGLTGGDSDGNGNGILIGAENARLFISGTVTGGNNGILVDSTNAFVENFNGAIIQNQGASAGNAIQVQEAGFLLHNKGIVQANDDNDTILVNAPFNAIDNFVGGIIQNTNDSDNTINFQNGATSGNFLNAAGATIIATSGTTAVNVSGNNPEGNFVNHGIIMSQNGTAAVAINRDIGSFTNTESGSLFSFNPDEAALYVGGSTIEDGVVNYGTVVNASGGNTVFLGFNNGDRVTYTQNAGFVSGNVTLAPFDSNGGNMTLFMNGGIINENLTAGDQQANVLTFNGGIINGTTSSGNFGDTFEMHGTTFHNIQSESIGGEQTTFNLTAGQFDLLTGSGGQGNDLLNINATYTSHGQIINVPTILVNKGTFTANNTISGLSNEFTVLEGATFVPHSAFTSTEGTININEGATMWVNSGAYFDLRDGGDIQNNGLVLLTHRGVLDIATNFGGVIAQPTGIEGVFSNNEGAIFSVFLGRTDAGNMNVFNDSEFSVELFEGSFVQPRFNSFLPQHSAFNVININGGGTILDESTLIQPLSAVISFTKNVIDDGAILQIMTHRNSYSSLSDTQVTTGVAGALDILALDFGPFQPDLLGLLGQLDQLPTQEEVEEAMESLVPPFNHGLPDGSYLAMNNAFDSVIERLEDTVWMNGFSQGRGVNSGDLAGTGSVWGKVLGAHLNQKTRHDVPGYKANAGGASVGVDWGVDNCITLGLAGSYTKVSVKDKAESPKNESIKAWQGTAYGWFEFKDGWYVDGMFGVARNKYHINRVINVNQINTAAQADFDGTQWGAQGDLGWMALVEENYYITPYGRLRYLHLDLDDYTEDGADGLSLMVHNPSLHEFMGAVGVRIGTYIDSHHVLYVPELTLQLGYDFENNGEQTTGEFIAGGPAFGTNGIKPGKTIFDLGLGVNAHVNECSFFTLKYNLELRDQFVGNSGYLQYSYLWS